LLSRNSIQASEGADVGNRSKVQIRSRQATARIRGKRARRGCNNKDASKGWGKARRANSEEESRTGQAKREIKGMQASVRKAAERVKLIEAAMDTEIPFLAR
jgi:hypothetical protein